MKPMVQEIPKDRWRTFFEDLAQQYEGWAVTVEVLAQDWGDQRVAEGPPLQGISFETLGSQAGDVLVEAGEKDLPFDVHRVGRPQRVWTSALEPGTELDIQIESADGTVTLVHLQGRPELPPPADSSATGIRE